MTSDSATQLTSQQSVKAYVDTEVATKASIGLIVALVIMSMLMMLKKVEVY